MMAIFNEEHLSILLERQDPPIFSLYMPTYRTHPDNAQDREVYKQLVQQFRPMKDAHPRDGGIQAIFAKFDALAEDYHFWQHTRDGLAVFATRELFEVYRLRRPVPPLAIVADSAHTKPLLKYLQTGDRYHVLVLTINSAQLFEGDRYKLDEVDLSAGEVPDSMLAALDHEQRDLHATLAAYRTATGEQWEAERNPGLKKTDIDNDTEQFFRAVDRAIMAQYSLPTRLPLILATLPEHHSLFRKVSRNSQLMDEGIKINAAVLPAKELNKLAWEVFEPYYNSRIDSIVDEFQLAASKGLGVDQLNQIAKDAYDGRVATLLLEENRLIPGHIVDRDHVVYRDQNEGDELIDDVLDDLGELVLRFGGEVWVIPKDRMPVETGAAAINRF